MNDYCQIFKQIIRNSNYDNTYKMAWAKALVEISAEVNLNDEFVHISFVDIAKKFLKYYWNQTIFFDLQQGSNPVKPPKVITYVKDFIHRYFEVVHSQEPILYLKAEADFEKFNLKKDYEMIVKRIVKVLKQDVSWRFLLLDGKNTEVYSYEKGTEFLIVSSCLLFHLKMNDQDFYDLINYKWALILETFNNSPKINKKIRIMDAKRNPGRKSLKKFKSYLDLENPEHKCFVCGSYVDSSKIAIDHVIPWSYMYSDDIWNLVFVCKHCNSVKYNKIPSEQEIIRLKIRNDRLLKCMIEQNVNNKMLAELKFAIEKDYVNKFWIDCRS